jgi:serine/threonine protein kinase
VAAALRLGHYLLQRRLDRGGMGEVYLAEHVLLRRQCALKVIRPEHAGETKALQRFEREVRETAKLTHPNVVQIFDYGFTGTTFYYVMEYLPGLNLEDLVRENGPLPPARAVYLLRQVCGALQEVHKRGLTHRDIKPRNILVCERGGLHDVAKLLDFGLVLVQGLPGKTSPMDTDIAGTPAYMAPEQWRGETEDGRADIYALGAVAYFLLTKQPPFRGRSVAELRKAHLHEEPEPLTRHWPELPGDLVHVVLRCLAKDPSQRFPDAHALESALGACRLSPPWDEEAAANWWRDRPPTPGERGDGPR